MSKIDVAEWKTQSSGEIEEKCRGIEMALKYYNHTDMHRNTHGHR
jgi:hypothetical protein